MKSRSCGSFLVCCGMGVGILFVFNACQKAPQKIEIPEEIAAPPDTTLGPSDVFDIRVFEEDELSSTFRVASDGTIDFPLLGNIHVAGKTPTEVAEIVETGLKDEQYLNKPQVSVFVKEYNSKKISVFGQVKKPGTFPYQDGMSVVEAISIAGGFTSMSRGNETTVIRVINGKKRRFMVEVELIGQGKAPNFILQSGDIVFVPERIF
jgi:protein involved in polysaccharide export with SLBB domain